MRTLQWMAALCFLPAMTVAGAAQAAAGNGQAASAAQASSAAGQGASAQASGDTRIAAELKSNLDSNKAKVGDPVKAVTTSDVKQGGEVVIPKGSKLSGHVTQVSSAADKNGAASVGVLFDQATTAKGQRIPLHAGIVSVASAAAMNDMAPPPAPVGPTPMMSPGGAAGGRAAGGGALGGAVGGVTGTVGNVAGATAGATAGAAGNLGMVNTGAASSMAGSAANGAVGTTFTASNGATVMIRRMPDAAESSTAGTAGAARNTASKASSTASNSSASASGRATGAAAGTATHSATGATASPSGGSAESGTMLMSPHGNLRVDSGTQIQISNH